MVYMYRHAVEATMDSCIVEGGEGGISCCSTEFGGGNKSCSTCFKGTILCDLYSACCWVCHCLVVEIEGGRVNKDYEDEEGVEYLGVVLERAIEVHGGVKDHVCGSVCK